MKLFLFVSMVFLVCSGFSLNLSSLLDDDEPLFSRLQVSDALKITMETADAMMEDCCCCVLFLTDHACRHSRFEAQAT